MTSRCGHLEVNWERDAGVAERLDAVEPAGHRALVVGRAAAEQLPVLLRQHERLRVPAVTLHWHWHWHWH